MIVILGVAMSIHMEECTVLKKRDLSECADLFELMKDPAVFPFVRQKAYSPEEYMFITKQTIELEEAGKLISRTILDEWSQPIGTITLFDIEHRAGFLGTWLGKPYFGKGYNKQAKDAFFSELFYERDMERVFMRIRKENIRSQSAAMKLPYVQAANELYADVYQKLNQHGDIYNLYAIEKEAYILHSLRVEAYKLEEENELKEA